MTETMPTTDATTTTDTSTGTDATRAALDLAAGWIGRTYDVVNGECPSDEFLSNEHVIDGVETDVLDVAEDRSGESEVTTGNSKAHYSAELMADVWGGGRYRGFAGELSAQFGAGITVSKHAHYSTFQDSTEFGTVGLDSERIDVRAAVSDGLERRFAELEPDESGENARNFFEGGSHVVVGVTVGAEVRYSSWAHSSDVGQDVSFEAAVEASYRAATGYGEGGAGASAASEQAIELVRDEQRWTVRGGGTEARAALTGELSEEHYAAWVDTISSQPAIIGFPKDGLLPIWELCRDQAKAAYLAAYFGQMYGDGVRLDGRDDLTLCLYGKNAGSFNTDAKNQLTWSGGDTEVLVGIGATVDNNWNLSRMAVVSYDLASGEHRDWYSDGDRDGKYEAFFLAPEGHVITGLGVTATKSKAQDNAKVVGHLVVWYQRLQLGRQDGALLDPEVQSPWWGTYGEKRSLGEALNVSEAPTGSFCGVGGANSTGDLELYFEPGMGSRFNTSVITGIQMNSAASENGFNYLAIDQATLTTAD